MGNGTLSGTVTDGANPISGATVILGSRTTTTNGSGSYSFTIPAGTYPVMTAATAGFTLSSAATLVVPNGGTLTKNFTLVAAAQSGSFVDTTKGDFQGGVPTKADLTATPGAVVLADPDSSAAANTNVSPTGFAFTNTNWAGQTFSPTSGGVLKRIDLELFCASCTALSPNITVSIRNTTGSPPVPTGPDLATATIAGFNDLGAGGLKTATFAPGFQMNPGFTYALVFRLVSLFASGNVAYTCSCVTTGFVDSNPYASGQRVTSSNSGANWTADTNMGGRDLNFNIWVNNGFQSPGTFVSSVKDANPAPGKSSTWGTLSWAPTTQPSQTFLSMQAAASDSIYGPFNFVGPDGTGHTTFTNGGSLAQFNGKRYLRYRANLTTTLGTATPTLSDVTIGFSDVVPTGAATLMTVSSATGDFGDFVNLSTTLTSNGNPVAGRLVSFELNGADAGSATTNGSGVASLNNVSLAVIPVGSYPTGISASWAGDASFLASSGSAQLTVTQAGTSTGVSSSFNPSVVSQPVSFTANVVNGAGIPTGTVQFKIDGVNFGSAVTLDGTGNAVSATTTTLALGNRSVSAVYSGSSTFLPSTRLHDPDGDKGACLDHGHEQSQPGQEGHEDHLHGHSDSCRAGYGDAHRQGQAVRQWCGPGHQACPG